MPSTLAATPPTDPAKTRRIDLILRQIDSLPTLPAVAARLLSLTTREDTDARQVIELISSDPPLTAKVLSICRKADVGVRTDRLTVEKAVVLLGFNAVRNAVLSTKVFELFEPAAQAGRPVPEEAGPRPDGPHFDRRDFWRHSLAVAVTADLLVSAHPAERDLQPDLAFVCGLLHDIGKLALVHVLPKSYARVVELVELNQGCIAEFERRIVGLDHYTAGKRLAEQWQLPHVVQDCIWLHGSVQSDLSSLPALAHRRMVGLVSLADLIVRQRHLGYSGNFDLSQDQAALAQALGLDPARVEQATCDLHAQLQRRCNLLGLDEEPAQDLFLESIQRANEMLGRVNAALERRSRAAGRQAQALDAVTAFHTASTPGRSVDDLLAQVVASAGTVLGPGYYAMLYQGSPGDHWLICQYDADGRAVHSQMIEPPPQAPNLAGMDASQPGAMNLIALLPWIVDYLGEAQDVRQVKLLPLGCGWGTAAILLHDRPTLPPPRDLAALTWTWGAAIAAAGQHDGARRLGEELVELNRSLTQAQDRLLKSESLARLGEMAAGAAHEMNNPLAVISGRAQLLAQTLAPGSREQQAARIVVEQAHRLSDLITSLRLFAEPPQPQRRSTDLARLLDETVKRFQAERRQVSDDGVAIDLKVLGGPAALWIDPQQIAQAVRELLLNALQALPRSCVHINARAEFERRQAVVEVIDDGHGMDAHTLAHAMDPFFSARSAGRRVGMGLPRARQFVTVNGGQIHLRSTPNQGTTASILLPLDPPRS